jgi:hypothetical protein
MAYVAPQTPSPIASILDHRITVRLPDPLSITVVLDPGIVG